MSHRSPTGRLLATGLMALLGWATQASADPISINSGYIWFMRGNRTRFNLSLSSGTLRGDFGNSSEGAPWPSYACLDCVPGSSIDPSMTQSWAVGNDAIGDTLSAGTIFSLNGSTYAIKSFNFDINAAPITVGNLDQWGRARTSPFTMTGNVTATATDGSLVGWTLFGRGDVFMNFNNDGDGGLGWLGTQYVFAQAPTATPEPGTLLLITGGIGALLARRRKARQLGGA